MTYITYSLACLVLLLGCGGNQGLENDPVHYNDQLVKIHSSARTAVLSFMEASYLASSDSLETSYTALLENLELAEERLAALGDFSSDSSLKEALQNLLDYYQSCAEDELAGILTHTQSVIPEERNAKYLEQQIEQVVMGEMDLVENLQKVQHDFSQKHNFSVL